jgi:vacuolar-type H+-ATPase catalytic subunit A/Vma1
LLRDRRAMGGLGESRVCIDAVIADLADKWGRLSRDIDERRPEMDSENVKPWCRLMAVYSQNAVRLGQLMLARHDLREERSSGEVDAALDAALAQLG